MATLQHLPAELLISIFDYLGDTEALWSLCLVSRSLCGIAQHLLYRDLLFAPLHTPECSPRRLFLLTRTIVSCPHLAVQVRRINLDAVRDCELCGGEMEFNIYDRPNSANPSIDGYSYDDKLYYVPTKLALFHDKEYGYPDVTALTSLLLSHLPNLEHLNAVLGHHSVSRLIRMPTEEHHCSLLLSVLRILNLTSSGKEQMKISLNDIMPLLSLPRLHEINLDHVRGCGPTGISEPTSASVPPKRFMFSKISFRYSCVDARSIQALLGACKSLRVFRYRFCASSVNQFNPSELRSALNTQMESLEHLQVSFYWNMEDKDYARYWKRATYGSLNKFRKLKSLDLDQAFLDDLPKLPKSLERFALQNCYESVFETMCHLARGVNQGALPLLDEVYLSTDVLSPGKMLGLPLRGATDLLFEKSCDTLKSLFTGTSVCVKFETDLLSKIADDYSFAFEIDRSGIFWPLIYLA